MAETLYSIDDLLERMVALNASDLHITVGAHPVVRLRGRCKAALVAARGAGW